MINRVYPFAADAPTLAGATNVSAFQLGITLAPLLGGDAGLHRQVVAEDELPARSTR